MYRIIVFEEKAFMMQRIKNALKDTNNKVFEANDYSKLNSLLGLDLFEADMIIAELDYTKEAEIQLIGKYLEHHPRTTFIVFAAKTTKKTFLEGLAIGASDYILHSISDKELKRRINKFISRDEHSGIPASVIIDLRRYLSGEIRKADKGNYKLTISFSSIYNEYDNEIPKEHTSIISKYFSNSYWDTDSLIIYGNNHFLSMYPFCNVETIPLVEKKVQHLFAEVKSKYIDMGKYTLQNTYATFPEEGLVLEDILKIIERKIDLMIKNK